MKAFDESFFDLIILWINLAAPCPVNIATILNGFIGGIIFALYGFFFSCFVTLREPLRGPVSLWVTSRDKDTNQLASYSVLFLSCILAATAKVLAGYSHFLEEIARLAHGTSPFSDTSILTLLADAIIIFVTTDVILRLFDCRSQSARRRERLLAIRRYQASALFTIVSLLSFVERLSFTSFHPLVPERGVVAWFLTWNHIWIVELVIIILFVLAFSLSGRSDMYRKLAMTPGSLKIAAPAIACAFILFYSVTNSPAAYFLRQPERWVASAITNDDRYPKVVYTRCVIEGEHAFSVSAIVVSPGRYNTAIDMNFAAVALAQGSFPGYADQTIALFTAPSTFKSNSKEDTPFVLLPPGGSTSVSIVFNNPKQIAEGARLVQAWNDDARNATGYQSYFVYPTCYLALRLINLDSGGTKVFPDFSRRENLWQQLENTSGGDVVVVGPSNSPKPVPPS